MFKDQSTIAHNIQQRLNEIEEIRTELTVLPFYVNTLYIILYCTKGLVRTFAFNLFVLLYPTRNVSLPEKRVPNLIIGQVYNIVVVSAAIVFEERGQFACRQL